MNEKEDSGSRETNANMLPSSGNKKADSDSSGCWGCLIIIVIIAAIIFGIHSCSKSNNSNSSQPTIHLTKKQRAERQKLVHNMNVWAGSYHKYGEVFIDKNNHAVLMLTDDTINNSSYKDLNSIAGTFSTKVDAQKGPDNIDKVNTKVDYAVIENGNGQIMSKYHDGTIDIVNHWRSAHTKHKFTTMDKFAAAQRKVDEQAKDLPSEYSKAQKQEYNQNYAALKADFKNWSDSNVAKVTVRRESGVMITTITLTASSDDVSKSELRSKIKSAWQIALSKYNAHLPYMAKEDGSDIDAKINDANGEYCAIGMTNSQNSSTELNYYGPAY